MLCSHNTQEEQQKKSQAQLDNMKRLLKKKLNEIASLKQSNTCHVCSERMHRSCCEFGESISTGAPTTPSGGNTPSSYSNSYTSSNHSTSNHSTTVYSETHIGRNGHDVLSPRTHKSVEDFKAQLIKKDKQIEFYRNKIAESYEEREQERHESQVTLRVSLNLTSCFLLFFIVFDTNIANLYCFYLVLMYIFCISN
jgi:hypothetical protein